jgi:hypothetical protein
MLWTAEGPAASLEVSRDGIAYARARGLTEVLGTLTGGALDALIEVGEVDEAYEAAAEMAPYLESSGDVFDLIVVRSAQARIAALRGQGIEVEAVLDWLESNARWTEDLQSIVGGLTSSALARADLGQGQAAAALLTELEAYQGARDNLNYLVQLPAMVRTAVEIGEPSLAERLAKGLEPRYPCAEHALFAAIAALTESRGELQVAAEAYADTADRWDRFGVVPEKAFALLGRGRCLVGLSRPNEAAPVLQHAREIFERLMARPALAEIDALLRQATALGP